jgi:oxygen-independent coproporphyrinogen III oxidase
MTEVFTAPTTVISRNGVVGQAQELLRSSFSKLPADYFFNKNAGTYLFNNIMRLIDRFPVATTPPDTEVEGQLRMHEAASLYVGVPWCEQICAFCNFAYSTERTQAQYEAYIEDLSQELGLLRARGLGKVGVVYFGGGTPTVLPPPLFEGYLRRILGGIDLQKGASVTCEATTNTMTPERLDIMKSVGVTRLSCGIQSLDPEVRQQAKLLGTPKEVLAAVESAASRFDMVNADLIYGYPFQSPESWHQTIEQVARLGLPSLTLYRLEVKERTTNLKLYRDSPDLFQEELAARLQYFIGRMVLSDHGYVERPLGWWIKRDKDTGSASWRQHLTGWRSGAPYVGIGQGAWSLCGGAYYENHSVLAPWHNAIAAGRLPIGNLRRLSPEVAFVNRLLRGIRTTHSIDLDQSRDLLLEFGMLAPFETLLARNVERGTLEYGAEGYTLTGAGMALIHWLLDEIVEVAAASMSQRGRFASAPIC